MFLMDKIIGELVEVEYQKLAPRCPYLTRAEIEAGILGQLESEGSAMRHLRRDGKTIAWKMTPKLRKQIARQDAESLEECEDD